MTTTDNLGEWEDVPLQGDFKSTDLAAAIEALQVTYGNIVVDNPDIESAPAVLRSDAVNEIVTERLWDAARDGNRTQVGYCLGVLAFWAQAMSLDTPSLEMRMKEVRNAAR